MNFDKASAELTAASKLILTYVTSTGHGAATHEQMVLLAGKLEGMASVLQGLKEPKKGSA